jgi:hypothetical protein
VANTARSKSEFVAYSRQFREEAHIRRTTSNSIAWIVLYFREAKVMSDQISDGDFEGTSGQTPWVVRQAKPSTPSGELRPAAVFAIIQQGHGNMDLLFNVAGVTPDSNVMVSLAEVTSVNHVPFLGLASLAVYNIIPMTGQVRMRISIGWQTDILVRIAILVGA